MKRIFFIAGMLAFSMLVYTCTVTKSVSTSKAGNPYPDRLFNPNPSTEYLTPEESLKTFNLPKGYHLELVASEPMIKEPVAIAWDGNAKMYVAEMLTYMQDADASNERMNVSRIMLLEDTNDDGKMDKSSVFIDSLMLPRMIQCVNHELLVNETNTITVNSYKDTNGDGKADVKRTVFEKEGYSVSDANMEHQRSGLDWNLDNYMYLTYDPIRFRYQNGMLKADSIPSGTGGQWGVTHDNYGRLFLSSAGGESPLVRVQMNPVYGGLDLPDQFSDEFQQVWPIIKTSDVQGGLPRLRPDSTLNHFTASCGQSIYRGTALPEDLVGDYIVCEPVARVIRRAKVLDIKGKIVVQNAYYRQEFIASNDMFFRPVNTYTGPDGNLYIVDMHRGIIQQGNWTKPGSFLREKIDAIGIAKKTGHGRIYRLVHDGYKSQPKPHMLDESAATLVTYLDNKNGWWRDNAQKQIVVLGDKSVVPTLKQIALGQQATLSEKPSHLARIHALWTLEGLDAIDKETLFAAMKDEHPQVRKAAVWISDNYLRKDDEQMINKLAELKADPSYDVRLQLYQSLYTSKSPKAMALAQEVQLKNTDNDMFVAVQKAMDRNNDIKTYGARLAFLPADERKMILAGAATFSSLCVTCHGPAGKGIAVAGTTSFAAPPLAGSSQRLGGDKNNLVKIVLHGLSGPVDGKTYPSIMPSLGANSDEWVASVVNYVRYEFGKVNTRRRPGDLQTPFVTAAEVKAIREKNASRNKPWTLEELEKKDVPSQASN
ncbi:MAG TPA: c-type cytochrome [Segetibacter sp.]|nr:c-type cytochrome [Segetibacter sp.]